MRTKIRQASSILLLTLIFNTSYAFNEPDSAYLFSYVTGKNDNKNGLHFAWGTDMENWHAIGPEHRFLFCDYGRWGAEKKMFAPFLTQSTDGTWHCVWSVNNRDGVFAHAASADLVNWKRQSYPIVMADNNCLSPEVAFDAESKNFTITWISNARNGEKTFAVTTKDFKTYSATKEIAPGARLNTRKTLSVLGNPETGTLHKVPWRLIDGLIKAQQMSAYKRLIYNESSKEDSARFAGLKPLTATIEVDMAKSKKISDLLLGIFFEDINYAADGGLYAELVQNRDFEYALSDKEGKDKNWNSYKAWQLKGTGATFAIDTLLPIHPNNKHYAVLNVTQPGAALTNEGFDGITVKAGEKYDLSLFARQQQGKGQKLAVQLVAPNGETIGTAVVNAPTDKWIKLNATLVANKTEANARLEIVPQSVGTLALDMVSLFPQNTFKGHKNGLRADLAQTIADIHPRFVRFPGGCVAHGDGIGNIYRWKNTIGPLEARKPQRNLWGYHQTAGLGYFEYFQFCEDMGAEPVPVLAAGVPCQNSATGGAGQQCGIPLCEMDDYIQEILDLIEYANGDAKTAWGKKRAEAGHPKPFNLKYIGIGNEDLITDVFEERFTMIFNAVKAKHPEITVIGTVGPTFEGTDYEEGWEIASKLGVPMVDEHYYQSPGWFIHNQDYYDRYDRSKSKVYLGEYAAHLPGRPNNIETALAEALYLTALERNGDVVTMTSYAPLLAKDGHTQWNPNLIYFNNTEVRPTVGYQVQKLYGLNAGNVYVPQKVTLSNNQDAVKKRVAVSVVRDTQSSDLIVKMVNLLPVATNATVNLKGIVLESSKAVKTVLSGHPSDRDANPVQGTCTVSDTFDTQLAPYSFTVIRINTK